MVNFLIMFLKSSSCKTKHDWWALVHELKMWICFHYKWYIGVACDSNHAQTPEKILIYKDASLQLNTSSDHRPKYFLRQSFWQLHSCHFFHIAPQFLFLRPPAFILPLLPPVLLLPFFLFHVFSSSFSSSSTSFYVFLLVISKNLGVSAIFWSR